jgi:hypothetical protein
MAADADLVPSGGSDFHGATKPSVQLGHVIGAEPAPWRILAGLEHRLGRVVGTGRPA